MTQYYICTESFLIHHGIKGQKWGVRRYQYKNGTYTEEGKARRRIGSNQYINIGINYIKKNPVLKIKLKDVNIESSHEYWSGHSSTPKEYKPNAILDHKREDGSIKTRTIYDENGKKKTDIHTDSHGHPKAHKYGEHGEHAHDYTWSKDNKSNTKTTRELSKEERISNSDIVNKNYEPNNTKSKR